MPGPGISVLQNVIDILIEPIFRGILTGAYGEIFKPQRSKALGDESVGSFVSRRFGKPLADKIVSGILHGIYAGDSYQLSVRSILPSLCNFEDQDKSLIKGAWKQASGGPVCLADEDFQWMQNRANQNLPANHEAARNSSIFTFKNGIGELASALEAKLEDDPKVSIQRQTSIDELAVRTEGSSPMVYYPRALSSTSQCFSISNLLHAILNLTLPIT